MKRSKIDAKLYRMSARLNRNVIGVTGGNGGLGIECDPPAARDEPAIHEYSQRAVNNWHVEFVQPRPQTHDR